MKKLSFFLALFISIGSFAQADSTVNESETVFTIVEKMPVFKGGEKKMMKFMQQNIQNPLDKNSHNSSATSYISFIVEKDGSLTGLKVLKAADNCPKCDAEAMRVISLMPNWEPGSQNGNLLRVQFIIPIKFSN